MEEKLPWVLGAIVIIVLVIAFSYGASQKASSNLNAMAGKANSQAMDILDNLNTYD